MNATQCGGEIRPSGFTLVTKEVAAILRVEPNTVLKQLSKTGSYCGLKPLKLPNRRLLWPDDVLDRLAKLQVGGEA